MIDNQVSATRRAFFKGLAALGAYGAFGGNRFFAVAASFAPSGAPRIRFGVLSDIHIERCGTGEGIAKKGNILTLVRALEWYRSQNVDAVLIAGDLADNGLDGQLMAVSQAWYSVFPGDKYPDGRPVEKIFVTGNHDWVGFTYGRTAKKRYPDPAEREKHLLPRDMAGWWDKAFHEEYKPLYAKTVKGYAFIGAHWDAVQDTWGGGRNAQGGLVSDFMAQHGKGLDPKLPFFYVQHPHLKDTCYGPWAWGHDAGLVTQTLSAYPNAIAFSGHSHYSLTDERSIWQGAFTSVGTSSLSYSCAPYEGVGAEGYENAGANGKMSNVLNAAKLSPGMNGDDCRQGMLWTVYDDCITVKRREFLSQMDLGEDWVMPLPAAEPKPFAFAEHAKRLRAPQFRDGATLEISEAQAKNRGGKRVKSVEKAAYRVVAPPVAADERARLFALEFAAKTADGKARTKTVLAEGFNQSLKHAKAKSPQVCFFAKDELGTGPVTFAVTPMNSLGQRGQPLTASRG